MNFKKIHKILMMLESHGTTSDKLIGRLYSKNALPNNAGKKELEELQKERGTIENLELKLKKLLGRKY